MSVSSTGPPLIAIKHFFLSNRKQCNSDGSGKKLGLLQYTRLRRRGALGDKLGSHTKEGSFLKKAGLLDSRAF